MGLRPRGQRRTWGGTGPGDRVLRVFLGKDKNSPKREGRRRSNLFPSVPAVTDGGPGVTQDPVGYHPSPEPYTPTGRWEVGRCRSAVGRTEGTPVVVRVPPRLAGTLGGWDKTPDGGPRRGTGVQAYRRPVRNRHLPIRLHPYDHQLIGPVPVAEYRERVVDEELRPAGLQQLLYEVTDVRRRVVATQRV